MTAGLQEAVALLIVALVVGFGLYRRWRKARRREPPCCAEPTADSDEKTVHFYRREDR